MEPKDPVVNFAKCARPVCNSRAWEEGPDNCPRKVMPDVIGKATEKCFSAFVDESEIGSVAVFWDPRQDQVGYTEYIFVSETWRRRGTATHLIARGLM